MARTPRTFPRRGHPEAKTRENIGQGKPREDVNEKSKRKIGGKEISEVSLTLSRGRFVGVLRSLPRLRSTRFHGCGLRDGRTWREGVLSLKHRRCNETNQYHPAQQSPHENDWLPGNENVHGRTSGDEERGLRVTSIVPPTIPTYFVKSCSSKLVIVVGVSARTLRCLICPTFLRTRCLEASWCAMRS